MKKSHRWAIVAVAVLSLSYLISLATAQGPAPGSAGQPMAAGPRLALLDVSRIFKSHARFKGQMEDMKRDVQAAEDQVKAERERITKLAEGLQEFDKGTPNYKASEEDLANRQAKLAVAVNRTKSDFLQREAKIYHNVYQEIWQATDYFCKQHRIDLVLRFNSEGVDADKPESVLAFINKPVVWYDGGLDITDAILQDLNRNQTNPGEATRPAAPGRPTVPFSR